MPRHALNIKIIYGSAIIAWMVALLCFSACSPSHKTEVDELNSMSYACHYRSLDSTRVYAERALQLSADYASGRAEAYNNLAFVSMARLDYASARKYLAEVEKHSDNQIEILIAHVQNMRLCQRESRNKDFYAYREKALRLLRRMGEEAHDLPPHERQRALYAHSEFDIVSSAYFYYVGQENAVRQSLEDIDVDKLEQDTAQYLGYLYSIGSGGVINEGTAEEICQSEFDYLVRCFMLASGSNPYPYWQANALQAISEHLQSPSMCRYLVRNNRPSVKYLNIDQVADTLLAGNFAQTALNMFAAYGDVYQVAGAYRTLGECFWAIGDYRSAAQCLNHALYDNKAVNAAPDLVASICERLCLVYSAVDDKPRSDYYRNLYLDLQERTRQDRQLEARASMLDENGRVLNFMIMAVVGMIVVVCVLLFVFYRMGRKGGSTHSFERLLQPLEQWRHDNGLYLNRLQEKKEEINEQTVAVQLHVQENKRRHLELRAKVSLVNSVTPFIDRMKHEVDCLADNRQTPGQRQERYQYISELTEKINQYNGVLTSWIQMRQGSLNLRISSFALQELFDIVGKAKMGFAMKGVSLVVEPTDTVVKADRTLTLFMVNTIADNARKYTSSGGTVRISATDTPHYVEISVTDTGNGMDSEQAARVFDRTYTGGHGFGLVNCKGIIEKYKKLSSLFAVCDISVRSEVGKGSVFSFRLPHGIRKTMAVFLAMVLPMLATAMTGASYRQHGKSENLSTYSLQRASAFADSAYFSNINGTYSRTMQFADSARYWLNRHYLMLRPGGKMLMVASPGEIMPAELMWYHDSLPTNYNVILDLRNESAVAALALHRWSLYQANNKIYTQLYREMGTDSTLPSYVRTMEVSENSKTVAIVLLVLLLLLLPVAFYLLYYRHVLFFRFAVDKVEQLNAVLLGDMSNNGKLASIERIWNKGGAVLFRGKTHHNTGNAQLSVLVEQIEEALRQSVAREQEVRTGIEEAEDAMRRDEYENGKLHVSCSVLENTLSALKHETMYYPSRIARLVASEDVDALCETVDYYKSLYSLFSAQAMEQVADYVRYDLEAVDYLFALLRRENGGESPEVSMAQQDGAYSIVRVAMHRLRLTEDECRKLFTPLTCRLPFLLCRQIVREVGEATNLRRCGIGAQCAADGSIVVEIVLPGKAGDRILSPESKARSFTEQNK